MSEQVITIFGERPAQAPNPSRCQAFRALYPTLFTPLQTETFERIRAGRSLALIAPTSSGKTLAVVAPLFEARKKAVFVYPFRALVLDQTNQLVHYGQPFGLTKDDFAQVMGGTPERELAIAVEKDYILMTPDKLVSLLIGSRLAHGAAMTILNNYVFVFDEIHAYNSLMRTSLVYFMRSTKYWRDGVGDKPPAFYFLSATFPENLWTILEEELGMDEDDVIDGVSNTGDVKLVLRPSKHDSNEITCEMTELGMTSNVVGIFNTAIKAWEVAQSLWGQETAKQRIFVGQDKMSELQRVGNFYNLTNDPSSGGLLGSPALEAGVDFSARYLVIEETHADSFLQRFGRAARSGRPATVLCYSSKLYSLQQSGQMKGEYDRREFLEYVRQVMPLREPRQLLTGLAAYPYYKFWGTPNFIDGATLELCRKLEKEGCDQLLAFRGFTPYTRYETGESISFRTLFKKHLPMAKGVVIGAPGLERYFFAKHRAPVKGQLQRCVYAEKPDEDTTVFLAEVLFEGFGRHWVVLEYKTPTYERFHPKEEDDNFYLRGLPAGEIGRQSYHGARNGILRFYEVDA